MGRDIGVGEVRGFFRLGLSHDSLANYYRTNFALKTHHNYSLIEIESMLPYERDIYVAMLNQWMEEKKNAAARG